MGTSGLTQGTGGLNIVTNGLHDALAKRDGLTASDYDGLGKVRDPIAALKDLSCVPHAPEGSDNALLNHTGLESRRA